MNSRALENKLLKLSLSAIAPWVDDPEVTDILVLLSIDMDRQAAGSLFYLSLALRNGLGCQGRTAIGRGFSLN